jgi:hypothetical protein
MVLVVQDQNMIIETILFLVFVTAVGAAVVKAFEWRQDVLYGPYIRPADRRRNR